MPEKSVQNIKVSVTTEIKQDRKVEKHHFDEDGQLVNVNGKIYIRYTEHSDGTNVPVTYRVEKGVIRLIRDGDSHLKLLFNKDKITHNIYKTPAGHLELEVKTTRIEENIDEEKGKGVLLIDYVLSNENQKVGDYTIRLQFHS